MKGYLGEVKMFAGNFAPLNWMFCDGQELLIEKNSELFSLLGTAYGGDGRTTFDLPDMRARAVIGPSEDFPLGKKGGKKKVTLKEKNLPAHSHKASGTAKAVFFPPAGGGTLTNPSEANFSSGAGTMDYSNAEANVNMLEGNVDVSVENTGENNSFSIMQPYSVVQYIICVEGEYPSRP